MLRTLSNKSQLYCVVYALHNIYNTVCIVFRKLLYKLNFLFRGPGVVRFDLGPLLQGQTRIVKLKSAYHSLIIGRTGLGW